MYTRAVNLVSTKADDIARELEDEIVSGAIPPGTVLRQETLSDRFEVSRTPVREALRRLAALGLVSFEPNRGVRVRSISAHELREAFLVRAELEALATEVATPKMTPDDLAELDATERRFGELTLELRAQARSGTARDATLFVEWMQANYAFHDVIYRVAELPLVERIAKGARRTFIGDRVWQARAELDELYAKNDLQHRAIREAIGAGSADRGSRPRARARPLVEPAHRGRPRDVRCIGPRARLGPERGNPVPACPPRVHGSPEPGLPAAKPASNASSGVIPSRTASRTRFSVPTFASAAPRTRGDSRGTMTTPSSSPTTQSPGSIRTVPIVIGTWVAVTSQRQVESSGVTKRVKTGKPERLDQADVSAAAVDHAAATPREASEVAESSPKWAERSWLHW